MSRRKIKANPNAVVVYCRVSTTEQGSSGLGLEAQFATCQRLIESEQLFSLGRFNEVVSGKIAPLERPEFQKAIELARSTGASLLIAKLDRLSREVYHISGYLHDPKSPSLIVADRPNASEFELNIIGSLAQEERRLISERTKAALAIRREQGMRLGQSGRQAAADKAREVTHDAIARAMQLQQQGQSLQKIADALNSEGYVTSRNTQWTKQAIATRLKAA